MGFERFEWFVTMTLRMMVLMPLTFSSWNQKTSSGTPGRLVPQQVRLMKLPALMKRSGPPSTDTSGSEYTRECQNIISAADDPSVSQLIFTITEKAPTSAFTFRTLC